MNLNIPSHIPGKERTDCSIKDEIEKAEMNDEIGYTRYHRVFKIELSDGTSIAVKKRKQATVPLDETPELFVEADKWDKVEHHDFVVGLYEKGETSEGVPYIAMELMNGTLSEYLNQNKVESLWQALWIINCLLEAMDEAHKNEVKHRDLKPGNILFKAVDDGWDVPKIGDWGSAATLIQEHDGKVTRKYSAPEQSNENDLPQVDKLVDVYQCGLIMYYLLTGSHPFPSFDSGNPPQEKYQQHLEKPSEVRPAFDTELDSLVLDCLQFKPSDRPKNAIQIKREFDNIIGDLFN